jgi:hypothetical protein
MNKQFKAGLCIKGSGSDSKPKSFKETTPKPVPAKPPPPSKVILSDSKVYSAWRYIVHYSFIIIGHNWKS